MEAGFIILWIVLGCLVGLIVGMSILKRRYINDTRYSQGSLNVDRSDYGSAPGMFLHLTVPIDEVVSRKRVVLNVNVIQDNSHK
jgi:hypothetical protein